MFWISILPCRTNIVPIDFGDNQCKSSRLQKNEKVSSEDWNTIHRRRCATLAASTTANADESASYNLEPSHLEVAELEPGQSAKFAKGQVANIVFELPENTVAEAGLSPFAAVPAPNCIVARAEKGFIQVYNNCGGDAPQRVKVVLAFGPDTQCKSIQPGTRSNIGPALSRIDGVYLC